jgi:hypothetical protein
MGNQSSGSCESGTSTLVNRTPSPIRRTFFLNARESAEAKEGIAAFNEKRPP